MSDYLNKSMLKERGWTEGLIKKKLPEPNIGRKVDLNTYGKDVTMQL